MAERIVSDDRGRAGVYEAQEGDALRSCGTRGTSVPCKNTLDCQEVAGDPIEGIFPARLPAGSSHH